MKLNTHLDLHESATVAIHSRAVHKKTTGEHVYNLNAGEPILPPHPLVVEAAHQAIKEGKTLYPPVSGVLELRKAVSVWMNTSYGTHYTEQNIMVSCGGKFGIFALCQAYLAPGDETIIIAPFWVSYVGITKLFGGIPKIISTQENNGWKVRLEDIEKVIGPRTKILFLNNASNPTGVLYSRDEIDHILALADRHNILVISDEVYSGLVYEGAEFISAGSFPEFQHRVAVIQSCSKHFAMTGWRVGLVCADIDIIKTITAIQSQSTTSTSSISQWAALAAFHHAAVVGGVVRTAMQQRRDIFMTTLHTLFSIQIPSPSSGLYVFVPMSSLGTNETDSVHFCIEALEKGNVAMVPGAAFGAEGYVRFSFGAEEKELVAGLHALKKFISE